MKQESGTSNQNYSLEDMKQLVAKWASVVIAIFVVVIAGSVVNFDLKDANFKLTPSQEEVIKWTVLGGYYGGLFAGPISDIVVTK